RENSVGVLGVLRKRDQGRGLLPVNLTSAIRKFRMQLRIALWLSVQGKHPQELMVFWEINVSSFLVACRTFRVDVDSQPFRVWIAVLDTQAAELRARILRWNRHA